MRTKPAELYKFIMESNKIEGIIGPPALSVVAASEDFLGLEHITIENLEDFVEACQPDAKLREKQGMDVYVGSHTPPKGGPLIRTALGELLERANDDHDSYLVHVAYETLHPFMDGNGRSGRILWAWQMITFDHPPGLKRGFLHQFYYQALEHSEGRKG
jgi:hypothetical protein